MSSNLFWYMVIGVLVYGALATIVFRYVMFVNIRWPKNPGHFEFRSRVSRYLVLRGWKSEPLWAEVDFVASKHDALVAVRCFVFDIDLFLTTAIDFHRFVTGSPTGRRLRAIPLMVCSKAIPARLLEQALQRGVYAISARHLREFAAFRVVDVPIMQEFTAKIIADADE
jgi:hypothetical protein